MLTDRLKENIGRVDILSDFDQVMITELSVYRQVCAYFLHLDLSESVDFVKKTLKNYDDYKRTGDVSTFYELFSGCPVGVLDETVRKLKKKRKWFSIAKGLRVGVVSRNNRRLILKYLNLHSEDFEKKSIDVGIVAANEPEFIDNVYTGKVELVVDNTNLVDFVREKDYICGDDEKLKLEGFEDIYFERMGIDLYICRNKQKALKNGDSYLIEFDEKPKNIEEKRN